MKEAVISNVLSIPRKYVTKEIIDAFTSTLVNYYGGGEERVYEEYDGSLDLKVKGYYYNKIKGTYNFYTGRKDLLKKYFGDFHILDKRADVPMSTYSMDHLKIKDDFHFKSGQKEVIQDWLSKKNGIMKCGARFGKTICMGYIVTKLKRKTLIIADHIELLNQWEKEYRKFVSNVDDIESKHPILGHLKKWSDIDMYDIVLSSWQKWHRNPLKLHRYRNAFGLIFIDEIHKCNAECPKDVLSKFTARYKGGVTATVERKDGREVYCRYIIGNVIAEGKMEQMICKVCPTYTDIVPPNFGNGAYAWSRLITNYCNNAARNSKIIKLAKQLAEQGKYIVIGTDRVNHAEALAAGLNKLGVPSAAFHGKSNRNIILSSADSGKLKVVVAMRSMLTGINIPRWDVYFNILPISNAPTYYQQFSRIRTIIPSKKEAIIYDFIDQAGICFGSFQKRKKQYDEQKFIYIKSIHLGDGKTKESNIEHKQNISHWDIVKKRMNIRPFFEKPTKDGKEIVELF
jgi:superfamily II DNA or RNA helicase